MLYNNVIKKVFLYVFLVSLIFNCTDPNDVNSDPPSKVLMVKKIAGFDTLDIERGIDAEYDPVSSANSINLMWYSHIDERKLSYYKIYRSHDPAGEINFNLHATTQGQTNELDTIFVDNLNVGLNTLYSYYVTVINKEGIESESSDTVHYTIIPSATDLALNNNASEITKTEMNFKWSQVAEASEYILRIERKIGANLTPLVYIAVIDDAYTSTINYSISGDWLKTIFPSGNYQWRIDCGGSDLFTGSESKPLSFTVNWSN